MVGDLRAHIDKYEKHDKVEKSCDVILGLQASEDDLLDQPLVASWDEVERQQLKRKAEETISSSPQRFRADSERIPNGFRTDSDRI